MGKWSVVCEPKGDNPGTVARAVGAVTDAVGGDSTKDGKNMGGLIVYVTDGSTKQEVSRVGFVRRNTKNPKVSFDKQLAKEVDKARTAVKQINGLLDGDGDGELQ